METKRAYLRHAPTSQVELDLNDEFDYELEDMREFAEPVTAPETELASQLETTTLQHDEPSTIIGDQPAPAAYEVDHIVARRGNNYLIKWVGFPDSDNTWEPSKNIPSNLRKAFNDSQPKPACI